MNLIWRVSWTNTASSPSVNPSTQPYHPTSQPIDLCIRTRDGCIDSYRLPFSIERPSPRRQLLLGAGGGGRMATAIESLVNDDDDGDEGVLDGCTVSSLHSH